MYHYDITAKSATPNTRPLTRHHPLPTPPTPLPHNQRQYEEKGGMDEKCDKNQPGVKSTVTQKVSKWD
jgi:hypothetical protein